MSIGRIADALWHGAPPANEVNALQAQISKLRRLLPAGAITHRGGGYSLDVPTDLQHFERLLVEDDHDTALALWRGAPFGGLDDLELVAEASRMEQLRMQAFERWLGAEIDAGRHAEAAADLEVLTAAHPTHERLWALRMTALYGAGRQADAAAGLSGGAGRAASSSSAWNPGPSSRQPKLRSWRRMPRWRRPRPGPPVRSRATSLPTRTGSSGEHGRWRRWASSSVAIDSSRSSGREGPARRGSRAVARTLRPAGGAWFVELAGVYDDTGLEALVAGVLGVRAARDPSSR